MLTPKTRNLNLKQQRPPPASRASVSRASSESSRRHKPQDDASAEDMFRMDGLDSSGDESDKPTSGSGTKLPATYTPDAQKMVEEYEMSAPYAARGYGKFDTFATTPTNSESPPGASGGAGTSTAGTAAAKRDDTRPASPSQQRRGSNSGTQ
ncbi:hypothetical protein EX30DRAFT_375103 [Ascodesmis nigricans]|uniref:Uncharacterized protein n=1 Tax=Ascodesmis nigricans TaxID=341454 RepID=A0A4S2MQZ8_9PEZI|nr:hypothetical protein EX30DRAFT_375103 [Ascodesmis nigricans]